MTGFAVLGICDGHGAGACLVVDGVVRVAISEERLTRKKNSCGFPHRAISECLRTSGIDAKDIAIAVLAGKRVHPLWAALRREETFLVEHYLREQALYWALLPTASQAALSEALTRYVSTVAIQDDRVDVRDALLKWQDYSFSAAIEQFAVTRRCMAADMLQLDMDRVLLADHHRCHSSYGYFSGRHRGPNTTVLTMDASGDGVNATISVVRGNDLVEVFRTANCDVGRLYRAVTLVLGLKPEEDEYKVMGLAPYAPSSEKQRAENAIDHVFQRVNGFDFEYNNQLTFEALHRELKRTSAGLRFDGLAAAVQAYAEQTVGRWAELAMQRWPTDHLVFVGGVALNVKVNALLSRVPTLTSLYVPPGPGDESLCIGAAYLGYKELLSHVGVSTDYLKPLNDAYLGAELDLASVGHELDQLRSEGFDVRPYQADTLAQDLSAGLIVGRCADRMEFGPRALGNRSILMDPSDGSRVHYLNRRVKTRDFWMPFAPVLMQDDAAEYLATSNAADYSFMTIACDTKPAARREAFAALHPYDLTARPQILAREANEPLADAIAAFRSFTGKGILLNTSLNLHGDPICNTAAEAAALLRGGNLDRLQLQNFYIAPTS